ncbi:MAG: AEC family transporter [Anaerovoracaceae bacterium]
MLEIVIKISTVFVMIFMGFAACKVGFIKSEAQAHLVNLILNITLPLMLINSICSNEIIADSLQLTIEVLVFSSVYFILAGIVAAILVRMFRVRDLNDKGVYKIIFTSINAGFMGLPITLAVFGEEAVHYMALRNILLNVVLYFFCVIQLNNGIKKGAVKKTLMKLLNPCIIGAVLGVVLLFAGAEIPSYIAGIMKSVGDVTIPVAMMVVGIQLADGRITDCFRNGKLVIFSVVTMLVWPVLILIILKFIPMAGILKIVFTLGAALPPATTISALAAYEGRNYKLAADGIIVTTLMSVVTIPFIVMMIDYFL